ncbi:putative Ribonuclease H [Venustampulla echinocandica]|uniref:Ribonuclease H n=1 Tax=Venustampulla echinocandica TaxID=2656787 RepID=A0A370TRT9_9HELO|nr:putative Ribonuclease H [Venustampulla echinocandica]RDL38231.1 putative Ribonuclease H [Venustampulla echinocandica]
MSTISKKRKLEKDPPKFYGVRAGKNPGVYTNWGDCQLNTTGFKGASYKSFTSKKDAEDFVAGRVVASTTKPSGDKFYGVAVGHVPGVYEDWNEAKEQIKDVKGPKYRKFTTRKEAEEFVRTGGKSSKVSKDDKDGEPSTKKAKISVDGMLQVWTDGSSRGNGKKSAEAGVGVYFGVDDSRNVSERLGGSPQTNQRAELTAILRALEIVDRDRTLEIITDSNYSINCSTVWYKNWEKRDWKTSEGTDVMNKDLVVEIRKILDERTEKGVETKFTWIKGHDNDPGNVAADILAVAGSRLPKVEEAEDV